MDLIKGKLQCAVCFSWIHFLLKWGQMSSSKIHRQGRWKFKIIYNNYAYLMWGGGGEQFPSWALGGGGTAYLPTSLSNRFLFTGHGFPSFSVSSLSFSRLSLSAAFFSFFSILHTKQLAQLRISTVRLRRGAPFNIIISMQRRPIRAQGNSVDIYIEHAYT